MNEDFPPIQPDNISLASEEFLGQGQVSVTPEQPTPDPESLAAVEQFTASADRALSSRAAAVTIDPETGAKWRQVADPSPGGRVGIGKITSQDGSVEYRERTFGIHEGHPGMLTYMWRVGEPTVTLRTMHKGADGGIEERDTPVDPRSTTIEADLEGLIESLAKVYPTRVGSIRNEPSIE